MYKKFNSTPHIAQVEPTNFTEDLQKALDFKERHFKFNRNHRFRNKNGLNQLR